MKPAGSSVSFSTLREELVSGAQSLALELDANGVDRLLQFGALLLHWNRTHNLTAIRDERDVLTHHLLDCLAVVGPVRRHMAGVGTGTIRILDVGSGGGLPGVVLALALGPAVEVVCVDAVAKKAGFVRQAGLELGLTNLRAEHARVEALSPQNASIVTSRAFASLADFARLTARHLGLAGVWMAMKGREPVDEIETVSNEADVFHVERLTVPGLAAERCLVWMRPR